jgi:class 3 adenylate cyclase/tetratricopeptide (TPR) repeat protein
MKCPKCQVDNVDEARFCAKCGNKLEVLCPGCGKTNPLGSNFCIACGHTLGKLEEAPLVDYSKPLSYTPKHLADKILAARPTTEGERKQVTVLFADVKGFTSISEKLDPEDVQNLIGECLAFFTEEIHRYEGAIAQFLGDGVMALFGAPIAHEDAPQRALYAALAIREHLREYSATLKKQGIDFKMRIGLNTGLVVVGKIGDDLTMEYTAMGDTVNLASRMESAAEPGTIQVSENTHRLTEGYFEFEPLGEIEVKGKKVAAKAYRLLGMGQAKTRLGVAEMRGLTPFVGRQKELGQLMECYELARKGQGQVVGIVGEPGVGKSRLLLQFRNMLSQGEYSYLEGECLHYGEAIAYMPILYILRSYFGIEEGEAELLSRNKLKQKISQLDERLTGILPPLQDVLSLKVQDETYIKLDPQRKKERTFEAIRSLLFRESQDKLLILAVEDLHWIDKTTEEFLNHFIARLGGAHFILILLYRPEYTHSWGSKTYYNQIRVDELPLETSAEMVQAILEEGKATPELMDLILDRATGNPLFMEEFTRTLLERGYIDRENGHYVLTVKPSDIQVPETVQGIIAARMDRLEKVLKETMQVASVIGREFQRSILQNVTKLREKLEECLCELQALEFIYERSMFPEAEYVFKHALTQEVAYNSLLLKRRKEIHEMIAQAIESLYPYRLEEFLEVLAHHYSMSWNLQKAYHYLKLSGDKASRNYTLWEAIRYYKEALNVLEKLPHTEENKREGIKVRFLMEFPETCLGFPGDYLEILQEGERLSRELGDEKSLANFRRIMICWHGTKGRYIEAIRIGEAAFKQAEEEQDIDVMIASAFELCASYIYIGEALKVVEVAPGIIEKIEKTGRQADYFGRPFNTYSVLLAMYGASVGLLGHFEEGEALCEKAVRLAREVDNRMSIALAEGFYGPLFTFKGDVQRALEHFQEALKYAEATQFVYGLGVIGGVLGVAYALAGDLEAALRYLERSIQLQSDLDIGATLSLNYTYLGMVHFLSGDLKKAQRYEEQALKLAQEGNNKWAEGLSLIFLGAILGTAYTSQRAKAEEHMLQGIRLLDELGLRPICSMGYFYLGQHYASTGQREQALQTLKKAETEFQKMGMGLWLSMAQGSMESLQG